MFIRAIAPALEAELGQPIVIENRPGANGAVLVPQIARGEAYAMATNVLMVSTAVLLAASLILLPLTRFFED